MARTVATSQNTVSERESIMASLPWYVRLLANQSSLGFNAGDANLYRYVGNSPTNATDPSGLAEMDVEYVFNKNKEVVFKLSAEIGDGKTLTIKVQEGKAFKKIATDEGFPFSAVLSGSHEGNNKDGKDTDSLQVAVRWSNATVKDVGHATNARSADAPRDKGADWTFGGKEPEQGATWTTKVPNGATHLEVIMVYTDIIYGPGNVAGDLPVVIGSFSGDLACTVWTIKANPDDVFKPRAGQPKSKEFAGILAATRKLLMDKTGYELRERPVGLSSEDTFEKTMKIIEDAVKNKKINTDLDTGCDIVPRK